MKPVKNILCLLPLLCATAAPALELIADTAFQRGLTVKDRTGAKQTIRWNTNAAPPVWNTAQHHSKSCFADTAFQKITTNDFVFKDDYETLLIHPAGADFISGVNAFKEYAGQLRVKGDPWPHLYLEQRISGPGSHLGQNAPSLAAIAKINFHMQAKLLYDHKSTPPGYSRNTHAAQFIFFFTIQNLNRQSKGFGDYYWFGITIYDDREPVTKLHAMQDKGSPKKNGTDKLIYNPGMKPFADKIVAPGEWVDIRGDLYPHILAGLQECWKRGFLPDSKNPADYNISGLVLGWEVTGLNDVAIAVKGLRADAVLKPQPATAGGVE